MIKRIEIKGYRLLDGFSADFGPLTVVIGPNATGKSSLLDCLTLVTTCMEWPIETGLGMRGGVPAIANAGSPALSIEWRLTFAKPPAQSFWSNLSALGDGDYVYEVKLGMDTYGQPVPLYECLRNAFPYPGYEAPLKLLEATPGRSMVFSHKENRLLSFDEATSPDSPQPQGEQMPADEMRGLERVQQQGKLLLLARMRFMNEYPQPSWIRLLLASHALYSGFDISARSPVRTKAAEIRPNTLLDPTGDNLGTVLHEMLTRSDYRDNADDLRDFLKAAYPSVEGIFAETTYGNPPQVLVRIRENGFKRAMELWDLSDGMLRFLCLAAALFNPLPPPVVMIDEPEIGLHPKLLPIVGDMIKRAAENRQVIITTHNPDLLNRFDLNQLAVMTRDDNKAYWHRPGSRASLHQMLDDAVGGTLGDLQRSGELEAFQS